MAVLLNPPGFQYCDDSGDPLAGGKIYFYESGTSTPKDTYTDQGAGTPNANPVILDASGRAAIWVNGSYKVVVKTSGDVTLDTKDVVTSFSTASGTTVTDSTFIIQDDADNTKKLQFQASSITTGTTTTITVPNGNDTMTTIAGTQTLTNKTLTSPTITTPVYTAEATVASATTTDLGSGASNYILVSGTTTITGLGSTATTTNPVYFVRFGGILTLTHNATSLILPGAANITTAAGDTMTAKYEGSGNWRILDYMKASGAGILGAAGLTTIASGSFGAVTLLDITSIPDTYRELVLEINAASNTVATRGLIIEVGDASHDLGGANNLTAYTQISTATPTTVNGGTAYWTMTTQTAAQVSHLTMNIPAYQSGPMKFYTFRNHLAGVAGSPYTSTGTFQTGWGIMLDGSTQPKTGAVDRIRITWNDVSTGVFDGGTYALYGVN